MKIILIYNWKYKEGHWMPIELKKSGYRVEILDLPNSDDQSRMKRFSKFNSFISSYALAQKAKKNADDGDILITLSCTPGIILSYIVKRKKVKIIALNLLIHNSNSKIERIRDVFYRGAFKNRNFFSSCNSKKQLIELQNLFHTSNNQIFWLPDTIEQITSQNQIDYSEKNYIFSGGISYRDWDILNKVAEETPYLKYKVVSSKIDWKDSYPNLSNLETHFNVDVDVFDLLLKESKYVILPLKSNGTAGLMVLFKAIQYNKIVICTDTETTRMFYPSHLHSELLYKLGDEKELLSKIQSIEKLNIKQRNHIVNELHSYVYENFSIDEYMKKLRNIINEIQ